MGGGHDLKSIENSSWNHFYQRFSIEKSSSIIFLSPLWSCLTWVIVKSIIYIERLVSAYKLL